MTEEQQESTVSEQKTVFEEPSEDSSNESREQRFRDWAEESHNILQGSFATNDVSNGRNIVDPLEYVAR